MGIDFLKEILSIANGANDREKYLWALKYILKFQPDGDDFLWDTLNMTDDEAQEKAYNNLVKEGIIK